MGKKLQPLLIAALSIIIFGLLIITSYHLAYYHRTYPGINVIGQPVGNRSFTETKNIIEQIIHSPPTNLIFKDGKKTWAIPLAELNFAYKPLLTAQKAYQIGRTGQPWQDFKTKLDCWFFPQDLELAFSLDQSLLESRIATIAAEIFVPTVEPTIKIEKSASGQKISIQPGQEGRQLDKRLLTLAINYFLGKKINQPIEIPIIYLFSSLTEEQIKKTQTRAEKFLGKTAILKGDGQEQWLLGEEELISFLDFDDGFNRERIAQWTVNLAKSINRPAENATFKFEQGKVVQFQPARQGQLLNEEKTISLMLTILADLEAEKSKITTPLPMNIISPQITIENVNDLGIRQLIGQGISFFRGSSWARLQNIKLAAEKLNGLLILPGEIFSFNQRLGKVSKATGFQSAYIIKEGRTILDDGGGVCQVSTTLFRAALDAGLPIAERQPHAYRVSYYEQNYQPGFDATVFEPSPDLKFKNDTPAYILIQTVFNQNNHQLTFNLYGDSDSRMVTISKARILTQMPPPPDLFIDDPALPAGQTKQIEKKIWGAKVAFDYKVTRGQEILQDRTFYSVYQPWQAVYQRGIANP